MPLPKHNEIRVPVLQYLKDKGPAGSKEMVAPLSSHFNLSPEEVNQMYESGNGPVFKDRISWAITYLKMAGLIAPKGNGIYEITAAGHQLLSSPDKVDEYVQQKQKVKEEMQAAETKTHSTTQTITLPHLESAKTEVPQLTPKEVLYQSFDSIKQSMQEEILDIILSKSSRAFEELVVELLQNMGYGGEIKDSGIVTQASNDQGIDGIIKKDVLGLERIYIQAKCFARDNGIGREHIQKFVGAIAGLQSKNGIFITTSYYHKTALDYVKNLNGNPNLILINGEELANYIYEYNLGMQTEQVITIKKIDSEYWDKKEDKK